MNNLPLIDLNLVFKCYLMPDAFMASRHDLVIMTRHARKILKK